MYLLNQNREISSNDAAKTHDCHGLTANKAKAKSPTQ